MKKGTRIIIILIAAIIVLAAVGTLGFILVRPLSQTITNKGYAISVPKGWTSDAEGAIYNQNGKMVGKFLLIHEPPKADEPSMYSGFSVKTVDQTEELTSVVSKNTLTTNKGKAAQYFIQNIPNPAPYAVSLTFLRSGVNSMTAERIAASFTVPALGARPPKKNITAPAYNDVGEDKTAVFFLPDGSVTVKNIHLIDAFISRQSKKESTGLDLLCYRQATEGEKLASWVHIESDKGKGYLYTYYSLEDSSYTYDNNPILFDRITKEIMQDKGVTAYQLRVGSVEAARILEIPTNIYRDNAEQLLAFQTTNSDEEVIRSILTTIFTPEQMESVSIQKTDAEIRLVISGEQELDRAKLSKDVAVLFRLLSDVETIVIEQPDKYIFYFRRNEVLQWVTQSKTDANTTESFVEFTEAIEPIPPPKAEREKDDSVTLGSGNVVYSTTVVFTPSTKVRHPNTGKKVAIGPYAEKYGFSQYLNKPIQCVIKRSGLAYVATAMVDGSVIYTQPLETEAAVLDAIKQLQAYS